ncbi:MAG: glycosyltransferase [Rhizobiales bacterium]|nr:glycosyltransferase [Hyphomicrobiales bacterium]
MRLAFVLNNLSGGGAEHVAVMVANQLQQMGHELALILGRCEGPYVKDIAPAVRVETLGRRMALALPALAGVLRRERFDAVFTILDQPSIGCLLLKPGLRRTRVIVVECNNPLASDAAARGAIWRLIRSLRPWLYPHADHIITKSEGIRAALLEHFNARPDRVTAISNPVDLARIEALAGEPPQHPWADDRSSPLFVAMGRLSPQKDFATLLDAFHRLRQTRAARLLILGEGSERARLEAQLAALGLADSVAMPGFVANPYAILARADGFVMSSRWEGWPNALVESLACGVGAVSTDCESGPREILDGGRLGRLVPVGDAAALAQGMNELLDRPPDPRELRRHIEGFTPAAIADRYLDAIGDVT